jgi:environmental stress-induced protein Ves
MSWQTVYLDRVAAAPWRNGGGVTRELLAWPSAADWTVRLSVADVERDGPFSAYPGVQRWFAVLSGQGVRLRLPGETHELDAASDPFQFDGAVPVDCELLGGATRDFNLMVRGGRGRMGRSRNGDSFTGSAGALVAVYSIGALRWRILDRDERIALDIADALWMEIAP